MSHHREHITRMGPTKAAAVWCLISSAVLVHMNLTGSVLAAIGQQQQQQQNNSSIEPGSSHLLFHHHHHHRHHDDHSTVAAAAGSSSTCAKSHHRGRHQLEATDQSQSASLSSSLLRTFIRTNNMRAYHLDLHAYRPEAKFAGDPAFVDSLSTDHQQRCRRHLAHFYHLMKSFRETDPMEMTKSMESLRLADTFGRPEAGLLDGNQFWLGSYERCMEFKTHQPHIAGDDSGVTTPNASQTQINGQYCLGLSQFPSWNPNDTKTSIKIGMCLPETCTSSMLNEQGDLFEMAEQMMKFQLGDGLPFNKIKLRSIYCLPHETSEIRQYTLSGKMLISLMSLFVVACIYATISDCMSFRNNQTTVKAVISVADKQQSSSTSSLASKDAATCSSTALPESSASSSLSHRQANGLQAEISCSAQADGAKVKLVAAGPERTWRNILVESFSIIQNVKKLNSVRETVVPSYDSTKPNEQTFNKDLFLGSIAGIKCIGLLWIIAAHTFMVGPIPQRNLIMLDKITKTYLANVYLSAHLMVDSFFVLSGVLASYMIFKSGIEHIKLRNWIVMTVHRYWRLTPIYLLCYWFAKSIGHLNNSGPLWDYMTAAQSPRLNCANESWLYAILQLSDFKSPKNHCVPFAWFIANGIKFWLVTPLLLVAIYKSVKRGYTLIGATILANCALVFYLVLNSSVDMKSVIEFRPESADNMLNEMEDIYTRPYSRIGPYLVGLIAGHYFYTIERDQKRFNLPERTKYLIWSVVSMTMFLFTFVVKIAGGMTLDDATIPWVFSFISAVMRPIWAVCTCWLVFGLAHGQTRWLASFLCSRSWSLLAKISFSAYLVQGEVIANLLLAVNHSTPFVYSELISRSLYCIAATIVAAIFMTVFVEYPLIGIEELILPSRRPKAMENNKSLGAGNNDTRKNDQTVNNKVLESKQKQQQDTLFDHDTHKSTTLQSDKLKTS